MVEIKIADDQQATHVLDEQADTHYRFELGRAAHLIIFLVLERGSVSCDVFLEGEQSRVEFYGLYVSKDKHRVELSLVQHHRAPRTTSSVMIKGILCDESQVKFQGTIRIDADAHTSIATLYNKNLVLSSRARVLSSPCLEVRADAVQCKHGTAQSGLDEEHLFYARSRGFSPERARQFLVAAFANEVITRLPDTLKTWWHEKSACIAWQKE